MRSAVLLALAIFWIAAPAENRDEIERWQRGVGGPLYQQAASHDATVPPRLEDLVIVTWNAHLAEGRLADLIAELRDGKFTGGTRVNHFVLLVQELFRRGDAVPAFAGNARTARAIRARDDDAPDVEDYALALRLSFLYIPSMRNGADLREDRGNAIVSTEPILQPLAIELPFSRQRRVAVGGAIDVTHRGKPATIRLVDAHLEPLSSPRTLWFFRDPRRRQMDTILDVLSASRFEDDVAWAGTVIGGDFNTIRRGDDEPTALAARAWSSGFGTEDARATHLMGRLDYVFAKLVPGLETSTARVDDTFGSDHHPVIATFSASQ